MNFRGFGLLLCIYVAFFAGATHSSAWAQRSQQNDVPNWQTDLLKRYEKNRKQTRQFARRYHWPIRKNYSNQRVLTLQEIDPLGQPVYYSLHNVEAAQGTRTQALQAGGSLSIALSGNSTLVEGRLGLWDGGRVLNTHQEFAGTPYGNAKIIQKDNGASVNDHTTHLAGTLVAQGINASAKGMAFGAQLSVWDYTDDISELTTAAPNLLISNHAYGPVAGWVYNDSRPGKNPDLKWEWWGTPSINATEDYLFGFYSTKTQDLDKLAYNNPFFLMVRSADNKRAETGPPDGTAYYLKNTDVQSTVARSRNDTYDVIPADATAKNVLTVGAANITYSGPSEPVLVGSASYSGWGPTDDGRIKPDLLGIGTSVFSSVGSGVNAYGTYSGTSMASANVSGSLFLLQELYARQRAAGALSGGQFMRAATLKGLVLHTADRPNPEVGPDYRQGWGLLNTEAAARIVLNENRAHLFLEQSLTPGSTFTKSVVAQGNEPLVVTLAWTDPESTATSITPASVNSRTPKLVNDLDLRISDGQQTTLPFVLNPAQPAQAATRGDNIRDNVEQVYIANPIPGKTYTITVSHKGKMTYSSQPYSIIVSGLYRINCQLTARIVPTQDTTICPGATLLLQSDTASTATQYKWFRNDTLLTGATKSTYQATQAGSYKLRITSENGCSATSLPVTITLRNAEISLTPLGNQLLCSTNSQVQLAVIPIKGGILTSATFDWLRDGTAINDAHSSTLNADQPGRYQVKVTQNGCQAVSNTTVLLSSSVNSLTLLPEETDLYLPQGATVTLKAPIDTSYQYQWYRNDQAIANAREYRLAVAQAGVYKVQVTQHTCVGWSTVRSVRTTALLTATNPDPTNLIMFYPNPAETTLSIRYVNPASRQVQIGIFDLHGVFQHHQVSLTAPNGQFEGAISVGDLPPGLYILQLTDGLTSQTSRFIKK
ncbi:MULTISPECIES: S8 family serine peptidase [unclassified Spirosoma]|uniref:S8 family serine peptidase n=1 Tax=unclassified Spirosoma TaxID=2621999 RepID=UPI000A67283C|nr:MULTISPECIES: S8 family serine peptidase [unclassified Spirosoma]